MDDLKLIKKYYGEAMAHFARKYFSTILEKEGLLFSLFETHFSHSKYLYDDIINNSLESKFVNYIYSLIEKKKRKDASFKSPFELLSEAGYILYKCDCEDDIQKFKKYYIEDEELCTFAGGRLETNYVFFAVKKNIDEIKRENFLKPQRQDLYGTSIISIQFTKYGNFLSIKNRYNHTVINPDATFGNNLDNIISGLTNAFEKEYDLNINSGNGDFEIPNYIYAPDGKYYKYNYEIYGVYYCINNIIIEHGIIVDKYKDKSRYLFVDYLIVDMKEKKIISYGDTYDSFLDVYNKFDKLEIKKESFGKSINIYGSNYILYLKIDKMGRIIYFRDNQIEKIERNFLWRNITLKVFIASKLKSIGDEFLYFNNDLEMFCVPFVQKMGNKVLYNNIKLKFLSMESVEMLGGWFLYKNEVLNSLYAPKLEVVDYYFLYSNKQLENLYLEKLKILGELSLYKNEKLESFVAPLLKNICNNALNNNLKMKHMEIASRCYIGFNVLLKHPDVDEILNNIIYKGGIWDSKEYRKIKSISR